MQRILQCGAIRQHHLVAAPGNNTVVVRELAFDELRREGIRTHRRPKVIITNDQGHRRFHILNQTGQLQNAFARNNNLSQLRAIGRQFQMCHCQAVAISRHRPYVILVHFQ